MEYEYDTRFPFVWLPDHLRSVPCHMCKFHGGVLVREEILKARIFVQQSLKFAKFYSNVAQIVKSSLDFGQNLLEFANFQFSEKSTGFRPGPDFHQISEGDIGSYPNFCGLLGGALYLLSAN